MASLRVYARLNPAAYHTLLTHAASADVRSVSTSNLPVLDSELLIKQLLGLTMTDAMAVTPPED